MKVTRTIVNKTIDSFFKKRAQPQPIVEVNITTEAEQPPSTSTSTSTDFVESSKPKVHPSKVARVESKEFDTSSLERDPGLQKQIWSYPLSQRDEIRWAYIRFGPYQPSPLQSQPLEDKKKRHFLPSWHKLFPDWLEYSPTTNRAYCLVCCLFIKLKERYNAFTIDGFCSWKKVNGKDCALLSHVGKELNSVHKTAVNYCNDLMNQAQHIEKVVEKQNSEQIARNCLRLKTLDRCGKMACIPSFCF